MAKSIKVRYDGVGVYANGRLLSRVQNVSADSDMGEEEARELTNDEVVEYTSTNPQVTVSVETNEYGSIRNILSIAGVTGDGMALMTAGINITANTFDGVSTDLGIQVQEDGVLARTCLINEAYLSSIAWNYDVGGVATEAFNFDADNKTWYANADKQAYSLEAVSGDISATFVRAWFPVATPANYTAIKMFVNGIEATSVTGGPGVAVGAATTFLISGTNVGSLVGTGAWANIGASGIKPAAMPKIRGFIYKTTPATTISEVPSTKTAAIGSIPRGKLDIYIASGGSITDGQLGTNFLRLQSLSIDVDFGREVLNELGRYRAYDRSLTYPIPVTITFSTNASDMEDWANFSGAPQTKTSYAITDFLKTAAIKVIVFDKQDTDATRVALKAITISGLQITSESFGVDAGGNATQDFTAKASNFNISGVGTPGLYPITHSIVN